MSVLSSIGSGLKALIPFVKTASTDAEAASKKILADAETQVTAIRAKAASAASAAKVQATNAQLTVTAHNSIMAAQAVLAEHVALVQAKLKADLAALNTPPKAVLPSVAVQLGLTGPSGPSGPTGA
jgi:hypothetical protein